MENQYICWTLKSKYMLKFGIQIGPTSSSLFFYSCKVVFEILDVKKSPHSGKKNVCEVFLQ
jgi:hypothetical protein